MFILNNIDFDMRKNRDYTALNVFLVKNEFS